MDVAKESAINLGPTVWRTYVAYYVLENPYEHLVALKQLGTVAYCIDEFLAQESLFPDVTNMQCLGFFLNGLREDI